MLSRFSYNFSKVLNQVPGNQPPLREDSVQGKYAGVLFSAASEQSQLHSIYEDAVYLEQIFKSYYCSQDKQLSIYKKIEQQIQPLTFNLIKVMIENQQSNMLPQTFKKYQDYYKILNKEEVIRVISARQLNEQQKKQVEASLQKGQKGVNFKTIYEINPNIMGGLQIYTSDTFLDCSLKTRYDCLKQSLDKISL